MGLRNRCHPSRWFPRCPERFVGRGRSRDQRWGWDRGWGQVRGWGRGCTRGRLDQPLDGTGGESWKNDSADIGIPCSVQFIARSLVPLYILPINAMGRESPDMAQCPGWYLRHTVSINVRTITSIWMCPEQPTLRMDWEKRCLQKTSAIITAVAETRH